MTPGNIRRVWLTETTTVDNNTVTMPVVDCMAGGVQWREALFEILLGDTDIALTALKIQESDDDDSGFTDITGAVFGAGGGAPTLPSATDDNKTYSIFVQFRKRYLKLVATVGDGTTGADITALVILDNPQAVALADLLASARGMTGREIILT